MSLSKQLDLSTMAIVSERNNHCCRINKLFFQMKESLEKERENLKFKIYLDFFVGFI